MQAQQKAVHHATATAEPSETIVPDLERFERVYIERLGLALFPLKPREKIPMTHGGFLDAVRSWPSYVGLHKGRPHNVGMPTGEINGFFVVDWDTKHGGLETRNNLESRYGPIPLSWKALTQSGGIHDLFTWDPKRPLSNRVNVLPGLDVRANGGYVVLPPSQGEQGAYKWINPPIRTPLAMAPDWLYDILNGDQPDGAKDLSHLAVGVSEGSRNQSLTQVVGCLLSRGVDIQLAWALADAYNECYVSPPVDDDEFQKTFESIAKRELAKRERRIRGRTA